MLRLFGTRPARLATQGAVLATVVGATLAFAGTGTAAHLFGDTTDGDQVALQAMQAGEAPADSSELSMNLGSPRRVTVTDGGITRTVTTTATTVGAFLAQQGLDLGPLDQLDVAATATLVPGMKLSIVRVTTRSVTTVERVPFATTKKKSSALTVGTSKTLTRGVAGLQEVTYTVTIADGRQIATERTGSVITRKPVDAVVQVGTKPKPAGSSSSGSSTSSGSSSSGGSGVAALNWAALAKCESGGNPKAVNPAGYYGLYQFSLSTWRAVGGSGNPIDASAAEQTKRAQILYTRAGAGQWPVCGKYL